MTQSASSTKNVREALSHAWGFLPAKPELALAQADAILGVLKDHPDGMCIRGVALRVMGRNDEAEAALNATIGLYPDHPIAHQELGFLFASTGQKDRAIAALKTAVSLKPDLTGAWRALSSLLEGEEATAALSKLAELTSGNSTVYQAANLVYDGKLGQAEQILRTFLKSNPNDVNAMRLLAEIAMKLDVFGDAEPLLERCLQLAPDFHQARSNYANVLHKRQKFDEALKQTDILLNAQPGNPAHLSLKATVLSRKGDFDAAIAIYEDVLERFPPVSRSQARVQLSYGHALKTIGRQDDAVEAYIKTTEVDPALGEAFWSLANLKTYKFDDQTLDMMRETETRTDLERPDYYNLCFALGKALEDRKAYDEAFEYYRKGNEAKCQETRYRADDTSRMVEAMKQVCTHELFAAHHGQGDPSPDPIFIVGLPRSGSTLLEQILASHPDVDGTMELPDIIAIARRLSGKKMRDDPSKYPAILSELDATQLKDLGTEYLDRTRIQRGSAPFFIDKMPNNFSHIGLIHLILPNAKIIDARRAPMAACYSGYKQLFAQGQEFTYSLSDIGRYYKDYVELMDHWQAVLPGRVLHVQYEEVVADLETQVRRILEYCGLDFHEACLNFHQTDRAVRTASSEQVRQPIYKDSLEQWRRFEAHLKPLAEALGPDLAPDIDFG